MGNKMLLKKEYFLSKNHQVIPHDFLIYWSPTPFNKIFLGKASFSFNDGSGSKELPLRKWSFVFENTAPDFIKEQLISNSKSGCIDPEPANVRLESVEDLYDMLFRRICPPHDDDDLGMKNFYNHVYSRIEDPDLKKLVLETLKEWSQPGYCLQRHCLYILKEIDEKEKI